MLTGQVTGLKMSDSLFHGYPIGWGDGKDSYLVDNTADAVTEAIGAGTDTIYTTTAYTLAMGTSIKTLTVYDRLTTNAQNLIGNELGQTIYGNNGANTIDGKGGNDTLFGLNGADNFAFTTALGAGNVDTITGFSVTDDTILIDNAVFTGLLDGSLAAGAFNTGSAATQGDDHIIYNSATGALLFDVDGVGGAAGVQFATLTAGLALTSADFLVI